MLNDIRTRTKIITAGLITGAIAFFTAFAFGLIDYQEVEFALSSAAFAAGNAILAALIVQGALPFIERTFRVATALTLLEYRDANPPAASGVWPTKHRAPTTTRWSWARWRNRHARRSAPTGCWPTSGRCITTSARSKRPSTSPKTRRRRSTATTVSPPP
jgi:hypothetical protein